VATGTGKTYDLVTGIRLEIEDMIYILDPTDVPLQGTFNGTANLPPTAGNNSILSTQSVMQKKVEWLEETLQTPNTTLAATAITADTVITLASGARTRFATGDIIQISGSETIRITGYGTTTDTITVTRAITGSAAQYSNAATVKGLGTALKEGSDPENFRFLDRSGLYNLTEIFGPYLIQLSETEQVTSTRGGKYGTTDEFNHQVANKLREIAVGVEQAAYYGQRMDDTTNGWRTMGGAAYFIATNVDSTTTDITYTKLLDQWQNSYANGGLVDTLLMGPGQKRKFSNLDSAAIRLERTDTSRGQVVGTVMSDFGAADTVLDRHLRTADLAGIDRQWVSWAVLRPTVVEPLAKTGDSIKSQVVAEKSMRWRMEKRHFRFSALT
jgi:hypothetical protein